MKTVFARAALALSLFGTAACASAPTATPFPTQTSAAPPTVTPAPTETVYPGPSATPTPQSFQPTPVSAAVSVSCDQFNESRDVTRVMEVSVDGTLTVTLCSNPSTGFRWDETAKVTDPSVLSQLSHEYRAPTGGGIGASGTEMWAFKGLKRGTGDASMSYARSFDDPPQPARTFRVTVTVK